MIALAALALVGQAAPARPAPADQTPTVVVTGRRPDQAKAIRHMTARIAPLGDATQPLARFTAPVCPQVDGLPRALTDRFAARMREDARAAGLTVEKPGCSPNITVLFVPNGQQVVQALRKSHSEMFGALEPAQVRRIAADGGPVHLWSFTELRSRDDDKPRQGTTVAGKDAAELQVRNASIIEAPTRIVVDGMIVLIDQQASVGKTIDQLADYTVMRTLAQARPIGSDAAEPTILRLFDAGEPPPRGLTAFDAAYLKAYYRGQPTMLPTGKVAAMARAINKSLSQAVATTEPAPKAP